MSVIYILVPITTLLAALAVWGFIAAVRSGQFDDLETPAIRMLHEEEEEEEEGDPSASMSSGR